MSRENVLNMRFDGAGKRAAFGSFSSPDSPEGSHAGLSGVPSDDGLVMDRTDRPDERTIMVSCAMHGAKGFCNLRITKRDGEIVLDPHVAGCCVIVLDETAATAVFEFLGQ